MSEFINVLKQRNTSAKSYVKGVHGFLCYKHRRWIERNRVDYFVNLPCRYELPYAMKRKNLLIFRVVFVLGILAFLYT